MSTPISLTPYQSIVRSSALERYRTEDHKLSEQLCSLRQWRSLCNTAGKRETDRKIDAIIYERTKLSNWFDACMTPINDWRDFDNLPF